jgi:hypothetical protein
MPKKPQARTVRLDHELEGAAHHVRYEIAMFLYAASRLSSYCASPPSPSAEAQNSTLESFLLHFRNVRAFLCPSLQPLHSDDVIASDFLRQPIVADIGDPVKLDTDHKRLDRMLSHLSYERAKYIAAGDLGWNIRQLTTIVLEELSKFVDAIPSNMTEWFPSQAFVGECRTNMAEWFARNDNALDYSWSIESAESRDQVPEYGA